MRTVKIISLVMALIMTAFTFVACGTGEETEANINVKIVAGSDVIFDAQVKSSGTPIILTLINEMKTMYSLDVQLDEDNFGITRVNQYYSDTIGDYDYFWDYKINGEIPDVSVKSMASNTVKDGDTVLIEFWYQYSAAKYAETGVMNYGLYDSSSGVFDEE